MIELLEALGGVALYVGGALLIVWLGYLAFGPVVLGVPTIVGVLVVIAVTKTALDVPVVVLVAFAAALLLLWLVIGMAMSFGADSGTADARRRGEERRDG